jgi:Peptidase family M28
MRRAAFATLLICLGACSRQAPRFSLENARAHVQMLAGTIGSRPIGTAENARARQYIVDQLRLYGFDVRVQEVDARRPEAGRTAHVANVIAVKRGAEQNALAIVSHYDSAPEAPGAADDAQGVAVSLEAARVLATRSNPRHTLFILVTDGEEVGLMGAAGLTTDRDVMDRLQAYINVEATGSGGTGLLFETGPGNGWIVKPWAKAAPRPRGTSLATEIYHHLPNDTDFSILARRGIPGLNFALFKDSYPYHTARDTPERLPDDSLRTTGENVVGVATALDALDLGTRSAAGETFFDIGRTVAVSWGPVTAWVVAVLALISGLLAWFKVLGATMRLVGIGRWIFEAVWALAGAAAVGAAMIAGMWALRATRAVYHPWYARPYWMLLMLVALGVTAGWIASRAGALLPARLHAPRHPVLVWSLALPFWVLFAAGLAVYAPAAGYLATIPLLAAGAGLLVVPSESILAVRVVSIVVLAVAGTCWLPDTSDLLPFIVALLGRLPLITPIWVYPALLLICGLFVAPPLIAAIGASRPLLRPSLLTAVLLIVVVVTTGFAYAAPGYTYDQPQRRSLRVLVDKGATTATYDVTSQEPGLDLDAGGPGGWFRTTAAPSFSVPIAISAMPFVFRTTAPSPGPVPAVISVFTVKPVAAGTELTMTIVPQQPGLTASFVLPEGAVPARSNFPGGVAAGRWRATYVGIPAEGVTWQASFKSGMEAKLPSALALVLSSRFPGGGGWQSLPAWLPQEHAVWRVDVVWALAPGIPPVPPLPGK